MAEENSYPNLEGKRVSTTFRGLLHFPHSLDAFGTKQVVYDGQGKATALTLGTDELDVSGTLNVIGQTQINNSNNALLLLGNNDSTGFFISKNNISNKFEIGKNPYSSNNTKFCISSAGYIGIGTTSPTEKLQVKGTVKSYKNKIISSTEDHELLYGSDNLFSIIVKKDNGNNFYIKNNYSQQDVYAPLWIDKATGEVNIRKLKVANITSIVDPEGGISLPSRPDRNSNVLPVGMVCMFPALVSQPGWHICDGSLYDYKTYPELGDYLGITYGGTLYADFRVPDYREVFLRGWGTTSNKRNIDPDVTDSTERLPNSAIQVDMLKRHSHTYSTKAGIDTEGRDGGGWTGNVTANTSSYGGTETRPVNMAVAYYIKW